ncbi:MAG: DUF3179 domain-containing protein [Saprospiraceae bacterium]|nr:DUF3179 domain-containing protein [Saprospiraceae bacterium]
MKNLFYLGVLVLVLFEIANVYFIMPLPGSQEMNSIDAAYFLYSWRWLFRGAGAVLILLGLNSVFSAGRKWLPALALLLAGLVVYATNLEMAADTMFYQPKTLLFQKMPQNKVETDRLVIGIEHAGEARAYPVQFLGYHHQVRDSIGGKAVLVSYCTVCRTGRVFEPVVNGRPETFRLVGMDHFNAMFEDATTHSWWRQATGEAAAGPLKGTALPEFPSVQTTLEKWAELHPETLVMQPDPAFQAEYDSLSNYESGQRKSQLTRRDTASWQDKSWVIGIETGGRNKAFDWNDLQRQRIIHDEIGGQPIVLVLSRDDWSFIAFRRNASQQVFTLSGDTLYDGSQAFDFWGKSLQPGVSDLERIRAYQEYWHSWQTFHPGQAGE